MARGVRCLAAAERKNPLCAKIGLLLHATFACFALMTCHHSLFAFVAGIRRGEPCAPLPGGNRGFAPLRDMGMGGASSAFVRRSGGAAIGEPKKQDFSQKTLDKALRRRYTRKAALNGYKASACPTAPDSESVIKERGATHAGYHRYRR